MRADRNHRPRIPDFKPFVKITDSLKHLAAHKRQKADSAPILVAGSIRAVIARWELLHRLSRIVAVVIY